MAFHDLIGSVPHPVSDPQTQEDAVQNLRHTLAVFDHPEAGGAPRDGDFVVTATVNVYGNDHTGLTWADLRLLAELAHRMEGLNK